jgi:hypothetical protein
MPLAAAVMSTRWLVWVKAKEAEEAPAAVGWEVEDMVFTL